MKIICLLGSPRKNGNSAAIAERFCETAKKSGAEVQTFALNELNFRGCQACMACKTKLDHCVLEDDLTPVLEAVRQADVVVLASPVYFWEVSAQMKAYIDRTYSYLVPDFHTAPVPSRLPAGKKLLVILTQGNPDEKLFTSIFPKFDNFYTRFGFTDRRLIRGCGLQAPGEAKNREDIMLQAEKAAREMCS
jgi:multimeric flavodoxin WrbA